MMTAIALMLSSAFFFDGSWSSSVRASQVAGTFYPAERDELQAVLSKMLGSLKPADDVRALIVPHAGYLFSGEIAATGYRMLRRDFRKVFILASNHTEGTPAFVASIDRSTHLATPLGRVLVSPIAKELSRDPLFSYVPRAHQSHIIEVQLPFLQRVLSRFEVIPIVIGSATREELTKIARLLTSQIDKDTLVVVSSDWSHYHPYAEANALDQPCVAAAARLDLEGILKCQVCGLSAIYVLTQIARERGWQGNVLDYRNSGDTSGKKDSVVGYAAIAFAEASTKSPDTSDISTTLLTLARASLRSAVLGGVPPSVEPPGLPHDLAKVQGCFVTLRIADQLRGCIGHIVPTRPLWECVFENAKNAALHDPRFEPVRATELDAIKIDVSVLTQPAPAPSGMDLFDFIQPGRHGLILKNGARQATFLPEVWKEIPDKSRFLSQLCKKGGMPNTCWADPATRASVYEAEAYRER